MVFQKTYMGVLWNFYGVSMIFCGVSKGVSVVLLLKATQNQLKSKLKSIESKPKPTESKPKPIEHPESNWSNIIQTPGPWKKPHQIDTKIRLGGPTLIKTHYYIHTATHTHRFFIYIHNHAHHAHTHIHKPTYVHSNPKNTGKEKPTAY